MLDLLRRQDRRADRAVGADPGSNWAAKTANYFRDELGVARDFTIIVDLPEHWQTVAILLGAWWAGGDGRVCG